MYPKIVLQEKTGLLTVSEDFGPYIEGEEIAPKKKPSRSVKVAIVYKNPRIKGLQVDRCLGAEEAPNVVSGRVIVVTNYYLWEKAKAMIMTGSNTYGISYNGQRYVLTKI